MDQRGVDWSGIGVMAALGDCLINGGRFRGYAYGYEPQDPPGYWQPPPGYYDKGSGFGGGGFGGPLFITPDEIRVREDAVSRKFAAVDADMNVNAAGTPLLTQWTAFHTSWKDFVVAHRSDLQIISPPGPGTGTVNRQIDVFEGELAGWQDSLHRQVPHGQFIAPPVTTTNASTGNPPSAPGGPKEGVPWWLISVLTVGGLGLVGYLGYRAYEKYSVAGHLLRAVRDQDPAQEASRDCGSCGSHGHGPGAGGGAPRGYAVYY